MAKTPEELEQVHEHNRKVLRELQFDSTKWLPVLQAIRALVPAVFGFALQAAAELHKPMRSGAIPTATRQCRWRDGLQTSYPITRYPPPADWDTVPPESLIMDFREISEGDGSVVRCWDFVDRQCFNRWFNALVEQAGRERAAKQAKQPTESLKRKLVNAALARLREEHPEKYPKGFSPEMSPAVLSRQMKRFWAEVCKNEDVKPEDYPLDKMRDTVARAIGRRNDPRRNGD
jgi:hypothetical protein